MQTSPLILTALAGLSTGLGGVLAVLGKPTEKLLAASAGFAGGVMLTASLADLLPESMHGSVLIRANQGGTGWLICNAEGNTVYCEMRVVDPTTDTASGEGNYLRIANIGSQQLQARVVTPYYGLNLDSISQNTVLLGSN